MEEDTKYVIDSSFLLAHLLPDEQSSQVDDIFEKYAQGKVVFLAPPILPFEVVNGLRSAVISKRINKETVRTLIDDLLRLKIEFQEVDFKSTLTISFQESCSIYDASYLALCRQNNLSILTLDQTLKKLSSQEN